MKKSTKTLVLATFLAILLALSACTPARTAVCAVNNCGRDSTRTSNYCNSHVCSNQGCNNRNGVVAGDVSFHTTCSACRAR